MAEPTKSQIVAAAKAKAKKLGAANKTIARATLIQMAGTSQLKKTLKEIGDKLEKKAIDKGVKAGLKVMRKAIRSQVPVMAKFAKRFVGIVVGAKRGREWQSKIGLGVGKKTASTKKAIRSGKNVYTAKDGTTKNRGVGIAAANIHWPTLGTRDRTTKKGRFTGKMPKMLPDAVPAGVQMSKGDFLAAMRAAITDEINKVAAKARAKSGN